MKQIFRNTHSGRTDVTEVLSPACRDGCVLIRSTFSLIAAGLEQSPVAPAGGDPSDKIRQVMDKIKVDGLFGTIETAIKGKDESIALGLSGAGVVIAVGRGVSEFDIGQRVASNSPHAEIVCVEQNRCAKIPDEVTDEQAAFAAVASIALGSIRLIEPSLGENVVVFGLDIIGLIAVQLLGAGGCRVLAVDSDADMLKRASGYGAATVQSGTNADPISVAQALYQAKGAGAVLITARAATNQTVRQAGKMCRRHGKIVLLGTEEIKIPRDDFQEKELTFQRSCSSGNCATRENLQAVLDAIKAGRLAVDDMVTHRIGQREAAVAYETVCADQRTLGVMLTYPADTKPTATITVTQDESPSAGEPIVAVIGAGKFAAATILPALSQTEAKIAYIADLDGALAEDLAKKYQAGKAVTDYKLALKDPHVNAVIIATSHCSHAELIRGALESGKHVFVENPPAMNTDELKELISLGAKYPDRQLTVGFNRRFSRHTLKIKQLLEGRGQPLAMSITTNAGVLPPEHWLHDPVRGGGRIIGQACHFIDLLAHIADSKVTAVSAVKMGFGVAVREDKMSISLGFEDGSIGTVNFFGNGSDSYPAETLEIFSDGRVLRLDNFRRLSGYGFKLFKGYNTPHEDSGYGNEFAAFVNRVAGGGPPLIPLDETINITLATFAAITAAAQNRTILLNDEYGDFQFAIVN